MKRRLYFASPYGFSKQTNNLIKDFESIFKKLGIEIYEPFERSIPLINSHKKWAYEVAMSNYEGLKKSDGFFAVVNGNPPDEGVMIELGLAIAFQKEIFLFRDDFRKCTDSDEYPLNLMLFLGLPKVNWEKSYFQSIDEISDPNKNLIKWINKMD